MPFIVLSYIPYKIVGYMSSTVINSYLSCVRLAANHERGKLKGTYRSFMDGLKGTISADIVILVCVLARLSLGGVKASCAMGPLAVSRNVEINVFSLVSVIPNVSLLLYVVPVFFCSLANSGGRHIAGRLTRGHMGRNVMVDRWYLLPLWTLGARKVSGFGLFLVVLLFAVLSGILSCGGEFSAVSGYIRGRSRKWVQELVWVMCYAIGAEQGGKGWCVNKFSRPL